MPKLFFSVAMMAVVGLLFLTFQLSYQVQHVETTIASKNHQLKQEMQAMHVLEAEWAYITRPERLRELAARYTSLKPAGRSELISLASLPATAEQAHVMLVSKPTIGKVTTPKPADAVHHALPTTSKTPEPKREKPKTEARRLVPAAPASVWDVLNQPAEATSHD